MRSVLRTPTHQKHRMASRFGGKYVFSHVIVGDRGAMVELGDSGSLILLDEPSKVPGAVIVGLAFANNSTYSYMIRMDLVVSDIEEVTKGKVIEPRRVSIL